MNNLEIKVRAGIYKLNIGHNAGDQHISDYNIKIINDDIQINTIINGGSNPTNVNSINDIVIRNHTETTYWECPPTP